MNFLEVALEMLSLDRINCSALLAATKHASKPAPTLQSRTR